jgi:hypothetical protein
VKPVLALVHGWLVLDFFGDARRAGKGHTSTLTTTIFAQSFGALALAAVLYPETPPVPFAAANLSLSTLLLVLGHLGDDDLPARRAADEVLLRTAPLSPLAATAARALHAAFALGLVTIGMALPPAILLAFLAGDPLQAPLYVVAALVCSGLGVLALGLVARAAHAVLGHGRAALLLGTLKAMLYAGGFVAFARLLPRLQGPADALPVPSAMLAAWPPYHAAHWLHAPLADAWRLGALAAAATALLLATAALPEAAAVRAARRRAGGLLHALLQRLVRPGPGRAVAEFTAVGMWRNAGFRARVLPLLGMPAALLLLAANATPAGQAPPLAVPALLLQLPAIYLPFLIAFLPRAEQPGAGWLFAHAPRLSLAVVQDAVWRALVSHVLAPVTALAAAALVLREPAAAGATLAAATFALALGVLAARAAVRTLPGVPFTSAREADAGPDLGGLFALALGLGGLGFVFGGWLPSALRWPVALAAVAVAALALRRQPDGGAVGVGAGDGDESGDDERAGAGGDAHEGGDSGGAATTGAAALASGGRDAAADAAVDVPLPTPAEGLRRELRAIAALYAVTSLLPLALGALFAP